MQLNHTEPLVHTTGPHTDMSISVMLSAWKIKMVSARRGGQEERLAKETD